MTGKIEVLGLGAGDINQLPLGIYKKLKSSTYSIYLRTADHPVVHALQEEGIQYTAFDTYYEREDNFESVYEQIVSKLLEEATDKEIIYALPGHPMLAERTVQLLLNQDDIRVEIIGGRSYLDDLFTSLKIDPIEGFQLIDGTSFKRSQFSYEQHIIFCQVYDQWIASEIKLHLLEDLPADYLIKIVEAAGSTEEVIKEIPLEELDRQIERSNLTSVYVPPLNREALPHTFVRLREVIATLRGPDGCEWDKKQTHESLKRYAIEEIYELIEAIDAEDDEWIIEELGDVLLQVMLHSQIGEDAGYFTIEDVIGTLTNKLIHRHPHVFKKGTKDALKSWDELKQEEGRKHLSSIFDDVPKTLPPLAKALDVQKRAAKVGFDWEHIDEIWDKFVEEVDEFKEAVKASDQREMELELGDILFVITNIARFYNIYPDIALNLVNQKFMKRFKYIENKVRQKNSQLAHTTFEEMDDYWEEAKQEE